ncbi:MAG: NAD(+) diphosphatase [Pseudomonadales bacterium]|mgnify:CR=1 FL=1|jgi:NAD+ diphosphatase|nr:NAD(+) diphosphatase [Pseudomonadales bacterium]MDP6473122.1 NAD(+) diphosphatase [Pseudomonadales bacterium]MDP6826121.1 NAD(+) diphosphatase [Pseudomonadales bacterium]MDP6971503.1 NAD(+) diphosphatase [Pseudomonadales bacterium]|tara:strand:- start:1203 stop:2060 length:858 start_codon:yes stop_codon:yes gene_type:complete
MWPTNPDDFESMVAEPDQVDVGEAWHFLFIGGRLACIAEGGIPRPLTGDDLRWAEVDVRYRHFMGLFRGRACFAAHGEGRLPEGYLLDGLRAWLGRVEPSVFYLAGRAQQLIEWHTTHRFCGRCGSEMEDHPEDRAKRCPDCTLICYPRLSPSIIVLIRDGEKMLLARNAAWPTGMYSTLAGFVEPGESIEQTVHREVLEEVGLSVSNVRYLGSQSWPFPNALMLGFHADYAGGEIACQDGEIADAQWFAADDLPNVPPPTAISRWLIDEFVSEVHAGREGQDGG